MMNSLLSVLICGTIVFVTALPVEDGQTIDPLMGVLESASEAVQESANEGGSPSWGSYDDDDDDDRDHDHDHNDDDDHHNDGVGGELEYLSCKALVGAEKNGAKHLRLFLKALRDANDDLADVHCVRAEEQVAEGELVRIEIAGNDADGETVRRTCEVELLRTQPGHVDTTTPSDSDEAKEHDRYKIEACRASDADMDPGLLLQKRWGLGYIEPTAEELAQMRTAPERSAEELLQVTSTHDERKKMKCPVGQAIVSQGQCGSCWAFASVRAYDDRLCRKSGGKIDIALAEQDVLSCTRKRGGYIWNTPPKNGVQQIKPNGDGSLFDGCTGGSAYDVYFTMAKEGRVPRKADKYTAKGNPTDKCGSHASGYTEYKVASDSVGPRVFKLPHTDFTRVKAEIYHGGSSTVSWNVYQSGYDYKGGLHNSVYGKKYGGHLTALIGYGTTGGKSYYLIANSWGTNWGEKGYMRMAVDTYKKIGTGMFYADPQIPATKASHRHHRHHSHHSHHKHHSHTPHAHTPHAHTPHAHTTSASYVKYGHKVKIGSGSKYMSRTSGSNGAAIQMSSKAEFFYIRPAPNGAKGAPGCVKFNWKVKLATSANAGNTANCGWYGCRVGQVKDRHLTVNHGKYSSEFVIRGGSGCVKFGQSFYLASSTDSGKHKDCGMYGCRVARISGNPGSHRLYFDHGKKASKLFFKK
jgi:cathepsin B